MSYKREICNVQVSPLLPELEPVNHRYWQQTIPRIFVQNQRAKTRLIRMLLCTTHSFQFLVKYRYCTRVADVLLADLLSRPVTVKVLSTLLREADGRGYSGGCKRPVKHMLCCVINLSDPSNTFDINTRKLRDKTT